MTSFWDITDGFLHILVEYTLLMKNQLDATLGMLSIFFFIKQDSKWPPLLTREFQKVHISASKLHRNLILVSKYMFLMLRNMMH